MGGTKGQVKKEGIELGDITKLQQEKIEELVLYVIQQQNEIDHQKEDINKLRVMVNELKNIVDGANVKDQGHEKK